MIRLLPTVRITSLEPQMVLALRVVEDWMPDGVTVTCGEEGVHGPGTLHPKGRALDIRTHHLYVNDIVRTMKLGTLREKIGSCLGPDFDVVIEDLGGPNEHLHVEYDPKLREGK